MPLYEYQCLKCRRRTEKIESVSGPHLKKCPHCGGKVEQMLTAPSIQFKGSGWYVTDYAGKKPSSSDSAATEKSATEKASTEKKESSANESASKESTPKDNSEKKSAKKK